MRKYEVVTACYVPVGPGMKWKRPGQVVTLDDVDARSLTGFVTPVGGSPRATPPKRKSSSTPSEFRGVAKRNTPKARADTPEVKNDLSEVLSEAKEAPDGSEPEAVDGRAPNKADE